MKKKGSRKYQLTLTKRQLQVILEATEIYARLGIGQFRGVLEYLPLNKQYGGWSNWHKDLETIGQILSQYMKHHVDGWQSSLSIGSPEVSEEAQIAWDLYQVIRHQVFWEGAVEGGIIESMNSPRKWPEMFGVCYDDPLVVGYESLAKIQREEEE